MVQTELTNHTRYMAAANRLARSHQGMTGTNPSVACLLVSNDSSQIIGAGVTAPGGRPHAEPIALGHAGALAKDATAYVTLEPCAHHGSTPPCAQSLIEAGVVRVVTAVVDPDQRVRGKGHAILEDAGVEVIPGILADQSKPTIEGYLKRKKDRRPFVTLKLAITADGMIGVQGEGMAPITGTVSQAQVHLMRARHDAILIGISTVHSDNPDLTCRLPGLEARSPIRIVLDVKCAISPEARLVNTAKSTPTWVVADIQSFSDQSDRLKEAGCKIVSCEIDKGRVALPELLEDLSESGISSLMVEGGATVAQSFLQQGLIDAIELFVGAGRLPEEKRSQWIKSPVTLDTIPQEFKPTGEWQFINQQSGKGPKEKYDHQYRFEKG